MSVEFFSGGGGGGVPPPSDLNYRRNRAAAAAILREGRSPHPNLLSRRQMESLTSIVDTLIPSIDADNFAGRDDDGGEFNDPVVAEFLSTSASAFGIDEKVARLLSGGMQHKMLGLMRLALWLLSTWYGTFILSGGASLSSRFPYFHTFSTLAADDRRKILYSWSLSPFPLLRMLFKALKFIVALLFFSHVVDGDNPSWKAIDYCGPDPEFSEHLRQATRSSEEKEEEQEFFSSSNRLRPALLYMDSPVKEIVEKLLRTGFPSPEKTAGTLTIRCDAIVVGSGSGGSVVAAVLAEAGHKVLVLEKGGYHATSDLSLLEGPTNSEMYEGGGLLASDDIGVVFLAGATVGGGSAVNWSASLRTPGHVTDHWSSDLGLGLFGGAAFQKSLDAVCRRMGVQPVVERESLSNEVLRRGCAAAGIKVNGVPINAPPDHYCGWCHLGCKDGKKQSALETWLVDLADSGNGFILPECKVNDLIIRGGRARGARVGFREGRLLFAVESTVVVVSGGAINTPRLLRRSGLTNSHIGYHLHIHPVVMAWGHFPATERRSYDGGILTAMGELANGDAILQTPALHPGMFASLTPWFSGVEFKYRMRRFSKTVHVFALVRDEGEGFVGESTVKYELAASDERRLLKGLEAAVRVLVGAGADEVGTQRCDGERFRVPANGGDDDDADDLEGYLRRVKGSKLTDLSTPICSAHQMGSCRMGRSPAMSAVGPTGMTWEVEGLFVADSSVFPTAIGVNPMVTVMATAYSIANHVLDFLHKEI